MTLEQKLAGWTGPSSVTEQDKQERAERMVREAVIAHAGFKNCSLKVFAKGSYRNNTNVRADSDVDIAVKCTDVCYWGEAEPGAHPDSEPYTGIWTPSKLRSELQAALQAKFPNQVDSSGSTAFRVNANSARVDADVVPCFDYRYYFSATSWRDGSRVFKKNGSYLDNYPQQQLDNGVNKNVRTSRCYKSVVRILKRAENAMVVAGVHRAVPSYFVECLVYNCSDSVLTRSTWVSTVKGVLGEIYEAVDGSEPTNDSERWLEVNECKYLFYAAQPWTRKDGRDFANAAWNYLGLNA